MFHTQDQEVAKHSLSFDSLECLDQAATVVSVQKTLCNSAKSVLRKKLLEVAKLWLPLKLVDKLPWFI